MENILYTSTRGNSQKISAGMAIKKGLADDGGLYMPEKIPVLSENDMEKLIKCSYPERAAFIMSRFLTDYTYDELLDDCKAAYGEDRFKGGAAPIKTAGDLDILELWHGPTCAFKDMALQIMPRLLSKALVKTGEKRTALILVATSGDTGKAALEGYKDVKNVKITVFYPTGGVSRIQKLQMATQEGGNVNVAAIKGNFDDAQNGVKSIFGDKRISDELDARNCFLSSANSINWGRLVPQVVYYVSAYCDLVLEGKIKNGDYINVCVPTGNFGNIFAAYIAKKMGLKINKFICASNKNNVLTDFLKTGTYDRNRLFHTTISPSMDILISSNLERLLYVIAGAEKTACYMKQLKETGRYTVDKEIFEKLKEDFSGYCCDEDQTKETIRNTFDKYGYLIDTHTSVAVKCALDFRKEEDGNLRTLVVSTASPYKFASDVYSALKGTKSDDEFENIGSVSEYTGTEIPYALSSLKSKKVRFDKVIDKEEMEKEVLRFAEEK